MWGRCPVGGEPPAGRYLEKVGLLCRCAAAAAAADVCWPDRRTALRSVATADANDSKKTELE